MGLHARPSAERRAGARQSRYRAAVIGTALAMSLVAMLLFALARPLTLGAAHAVHAPVSATDAVLSWDPLARLATLRVKRSRYGDPPEQLARVLDRRIGPVRWSTPRADSWIRVVTATGHLPAELYRHSYEAQLQAFRECLDESRRAPGDERFVREWACGRQAPPAEEEFARIELQWRCAALRCEWFSMDPAAWQRVLAAPCRAGSTTECASELLAYLATGALDSER